MTTYTWKVTQLERETTDGYVYTAHWTLNATETVEDKTYTAGAYGSIGFERPEEDLIPFEDLTEELVTSWVLDKLGEEQVVNMETSLTNQIQEQKIPSKLQGLPWA
jgi:hypothetical protein